MRKRICNGNQSSGKRVVGIIAVMTMTITTITAGSGCIVKTSEADFYNGRSITSSKNVYYDIAKNGADYVDDNIIGRTIANSNIVGGNVEDSHLKNDVIDTALVTLSTVSGGTLYDAYVTDSAVSDATVIGGEILQSSINQTNLEYSTSNNSLFYNDTFNNANSYNDSILYSYIRDSVLTGTRATDSDIASSELISSQVSGSTLYDVNSDGSLFIKDKIVDSSIGGGTTKQSEVINSTLDGGYIVQSTISGNSVLKSTGTYETVSGNGVRRTVINESNSYDRDIQDSTINKSNVSNGYIRNTHITDSSLSGVEVIASQVSGSTLIGGSVSGSTIMNDTIRDASVHFTSMDDNTIVDNVDIRNSRLNDVSVNDGSVQDSYISGSTFVNTNNINNFSIRPVMTSVASTLEHIIDGTITNSTLEQAKVTDSTLNNGTVSTSTISGSTLTGTTSKNNNILNSILKSITSIGDMVSKSTFVKGVVEAITSISNGFSGTTVTKGVITGGSISGNSLINDSDVRDADVRNSTLQNTSVNSSSLNGVTVHNSTVSGSTLRNTTLWNVTVQNIENFMTIIEQPQDITINRGGTAALRLNATGNITSYTWSFKATGASSWSTVGTGNPCNMSITNDTEEGVYRCQLKDSNGNTIYSNEAALIISKGTTLKITKQPESVYALANTSTTLSCKADGVGLTYQWQWHDANKSNWSNSWGTGATITKTVRENWDGRVFRCLVTDAQGNSVVTNQEIINIEGVVTQPEDQYACVGDTVYFEVDAKGATSYQWYFSQDAGKSWKMSGMSGASTKKLTVPVTEKRIGQSYRCTVTGVDGNTFNSNSATIMNEQFAITKQPVDQYANVGDTVYFDIVAGLAQSYQWYYSQDGGNTWKASGMTGSTTNKLTVPVTANRIGQQYRCVVKGTNGKTITSSSSTIKANPVITTQPTDVLASVGEQISFEVIALGAKNFQWYFSKDGGNTWKASGMAGAKTNRMTIPVVASRIGQKYRCEVTSASGNTVTSDTVTIKSKLAITSQPVDVFAAIGETISFSVTADGVSNYQWYFSKDGGNTWIPSGMTGATTDSLTIPVTEARINQKYKCMLTDVEGSTLTSDVVTIYSTFAISQQPVDVYASEGETVHFSLVAHGAIGYQWYFSQDGGNTWNASGMTGSTTDTLTIPVILKRIGQKYRCTVTGENGDTIDSNVVTINGALGQTLMPTYLSATNSQINLVEEIIPEITIMNQPSDLKAFFGDNVRFEIAADGVEEYQWYYSEDGDIWNKAVEGGMYGADTSCLEVSVDDWTSCLHFRCELTGHDGEVIISDAVKCIIEVQSEEDSSINEKEDEEKPKEIVTDDEALIGNDSSTLIDNPDDQSIEGTDNITIQVNEAVDETSLVTEKSSDEVMIDDTSESKSKMEGDAYAVDNSVYETLDDECNDCLDEISEINSDIDQQ